MPGCFCSCTTTILLTLQLGCFMTGCDRVFYYPDMKDRGSPADESLVFEDTFFKTADGLKLHGWFLPVQRDTQPLGTVLHVHGNAGNITGHYQGVSWLPAAGYNVFTFDYRGFGRSQGRVTRHGTLTDAQAALDYILGRPDVDPNRVVVFGQSIGGAVAIVLTAERRDEIQALVVDGAFSGYRGVARHHVNRNPLLFALAWWYPFLVDEDLNPIDYVDRVSPVPLLLMHGRDDRVVPCSMSQALFEKAQDPKQVWLIEEMGHYEIWQRRPDEARRRVLDFLASALEKSAPTQGRSPG